jgi:hypothetical protein
MRRFQALWENPVKHGQNRGGCAKNLSTKRVAYIHESRLSQKIAEVTKKRALRSLGRVGIH